MRPASHVLEEESRRALRGVLPAAWVIRDLWPDYGADLHVEIFQDSLPTAYEFAIQLKAKTRRRAADPLSITLDRRTVNYLMQRPFPAMLVAFDATTKRLYYRWLDECVAADEYSAHPRASSRNGPLTVAFPQEAELTTINVSRVLDHFKVAGVSEERLIALLNALPAADAAERYQLLHELRFLRTPDGVLYALSMLSLDALLTGIAPTASDAAPFAVAVDAFLAACLDRPTPAATLFFWGVTAHVANAAENSYTKLGRHLFDRMLPRFLAMNPAMLAHQSHELFGYSAASGIEKMGEVVPDHNLAVLIRAVLRRLAPMKGTKASRPTAGEMYAALYTVVNMDGAVVYLLDSELQVLCSAYEAGRAMVENSEAEEDCHFRGYFEALSRAFGYQFHLEDERSQRKFDAFITSMAVRKVDLFTHCLGVVTARDQDRTGWSLEDVVQHAAADMLTYQRVYWYGQALDWFQLSSFCRDTFHGGR